MIIAIAAAVWVFIAAVVAIVFARSIHQADEREGICPNSPATVNGRFEESA